tara:strand:+ start:2479 stop:3129 length:651 start_codon:yes stop_codon:yes gene_type:complete
MAQKIHNYAIDRTTLGDDDYFDIDYWDGSVYRTAKIKGSNLSNGIGGIGKFSQTSVATAITNTTTESSLLTGAGFLGDLLFDTNTFQLGDSYHLKIGGYLSCLVNSDVNIRVKFGSILLSLSTIRLSLTSFKFFEIEVDFTIRSVGGAGVGSVISMIELRHLSDSGNTINGLQYCVDNFATFDTTIANTLDVTWEWSTASNSNFIQSAVTNLKKTY